MSLLGRLRNPEDAAAWFDFHQRYAELISRVGRAHGLQPADREDVVQDVLIELTRSFADARYDPERGRFRSYLKTMVQRAVFRRFRQNGRQTRQPSTTPANGRPPSSDNADRIWEREWRSHHLRRAMRTIEVEFSEINRHAFMLLTVNGRSARATADALGISEAQAYQAKSRILARLSELVEQQVREEG
jgi:RNA polymerase sigma-70 factor (ECF subfamily)